MNKSGWSKIALVQAGAVMMLGWGASAAHASDRYAAYVVDAQTHEVLYNEDADAARHPASLTKMMTLYMLFGAIDRGELTLDSRMPVSRHASRQAPTKLGLRAGQTLRVEDAIRAIVTKSANDAAVVIAERLGGSESAFAAKMTERAHTMGMINTRFVNASGLPNPRQITTARDIATLSEHLLVDYPKYYAYFQTPGMQWGRHYAANHNHLLGQVEGVDGIKTGYTNASGYNLASSVSRHGKRLIAVVMGGQTAASRDAQVAYLIENAYSELSARAAGAPTATFAAMPITRAQVDFNSTDLRLTTTTHDSAQYTSPAPSGAAAIAGNSLGSGGAPLASAPVSASAIDQQAGGAGGLY